MRERPILFSAPMVRALLAGTKTQTRREAIKCSTPGRVVLCDFDAVECLLELENTFNGQRSWKSCPYGQPGDRLWVRESLMAVWDDRQYIVDYAYAADGLKVPRCPDLAPEFSDCMAFAHLVRPGGVPSIHMPRWASRISLEIVGVRVERLHDISEADALAEGVPNSLNLPGGRFARENFEHLWWTINGDGAWEINPWVWVVEFRRVT